MPTQPSRMVLTHVFFPFRSHFRRPNLEGSPPSFRRSTPASEHPNHLLTSPCTIPSSEHPSHSRTLLCTTPCSEHPNHSRALQHLAASMTTTSTSPSTRCAPRWMTFVPPCASSTRQRGMIATMVGHARCSSGKGGRDGDWRG